VGNIIRLWRQNPDLTYYCRLVSEFATHLRDKGYTISAVERAMLSAAAKIDVNANPLLSNTAPTSAGPKRLYLHWRYSTHGPGRNTLRHLYNKQLRGHDGFDEMIFAFSRPKNLRDLLTNTVLNKIPGSLMSDSIASSRLTEKTMIPPESANPRYTTMVESSNTPHEHPQRGIQV
jgi:hypothetical protein